MNYIDYEYLSVWINEYQRISRGHRIYAAFFSLFHFLVRIVIYRAFIM